MGLIHKLLFASFITQWLSGIILSLHIKEMTSQEAACGVKLPDDFQLKEQCASCTPDRCGKTSSLKGRNSCSCDKFCKVYGDCCKDFQNKCGKEYVDAMQLQKSVGKLESSCLKLSRFSHRLFVSSCMSDSNACQRSTSQMNSYLPVTDNNTGVHYSNFKCAKCNGVNLGKPWNIKISCRNGTLTRLKIKVQTNFSHTLSALSESEIFELIQSSMCRVKMSPPKGMKTPPVCRPVISTCAAGCKNQSIQKKCREYQSYVTGPPRRLFKNPHCAACNGVSQSHINCYAHWQEVRTDKQMGFSFSVLMDFNPSSGIRIGGKRAVKCPKGKVAIDGRCVPARCRPGFERRGQNCVASSDSVVNTTFSVVVQPQLGQDLHNPAALLGGFPYFAFKIAKKSLNQIIGKYLWRNLDVYVEPWSESEFRMYLTYRHVSNITMEDVDKVNEDIKMALEKISPAVFQVNLTLEVLNITVENLVNTTDCVRVYYKRSQYKILSNKTLVLLKSGVHVIPENYDARGRFAYICVDWNNTSRYIKPKPANASKVQGVLTVVCTSLSLLALSVRLALQCKVPAYKRFPGKLQFSLCLALFVATSAFLLGPLVAPFRVPCFVVAVLVHWGYLSAFLWMSTIAFHTWWLFRPSQAIRKYDEVSHSMLRHSGAALGIPTLLVAICIGIDLSLKRSWLKPRYGNGICWITNKYALISFFVIPVGVCILFNIIIFVFTSCIISKALASAAEITGYDHRRNFAIYLRLFIMMGTTWIFGFIAAGTQQEALWYIFIVLNASQGIFIFIAFVCTKQVWQTLIRKQQDHSYTRRKKSGSSYKMGTLERSTTTTTTSLLANHSDARDSLNNDHKA